MSQKPKLIISLTSPYARKVRIAAIEKGIDFEEVVDVPWNENTGVIALNPLGKVPVWITEQNESIYDSRLIVEYLDNLVPTGLYSENKKVYFEVKKMEALAEGVMDASLNLFAERKKRPKELQYPWWIERQFSKVHRGLAEFEKLIGSKEYFFEEHLTVVDLGVVSALGYVGLRFSDDFSWQSLYPNLARYYANMMQKNSVEKTIPIL